MTLRLRFMLLCAFFLLAGSFVFAGTASAIPSEIAPIGEGYWCATVVTSAPGDSYSGRTICGFSSQSSCLSALANLINTTENFYNETVYDSYCRQTRWAVG